MSVVKVEIKLVDGEWQWLGKLSEAQLKTLCAIATALSDLSMEEETNG